MSRTIVWLADSACGSGPTCPRVGRDEERGAVIVQGPLVSDPAVLASHDVATGQALIVVPAALMPDAGTGRCRWVTVDTSGRLAYVLGELVADTATRTAHEVPDCEVLVAIDDSWVEVA